MRTILAAAVALLLAAPAQAQVNPQNMPASTVYGRLNSGPGPGQAIPLSILTSNLLTSLGAGGVTNSFLANMAASTTKCNQTTVSASPQDCVRASADKTYYVSTTGNDSNSGLDPLYPKLTINAAITAAAPGGHVVVGAGTYTVSTPVGMRPGVYLECVPGATIIQANGANQSAVVDFSGFFAGSAATGATMRFCTVDGNQANNTNYIVLGSNVGNVYFGNTNNVTIDSNIIQNAPGFGIIGASQTNLIVSNNTITNTVGNGIFVAQLTGNFQGNCRLINNYISGTILVEGVDGCIIANNTMTGTLIGGQGASQTVNTSGTGVTWVSGPQFGSAVPGMVVLAGGTQSFIKTVNSATSITTTTSMGTQTGAASVEGTNDLIAVAASKTLVAHNYMKSGASFGISTFDLSAEALNENVYIGNIMDSQGRMGFATFVTAGSGAKNQSIIGNSVLNSNLDGAAACSSGPGCAHSYLLSSSSGSFANILLDGNYARDDNGLTNAWLGLSSVTAGSVSIGANSQSGAANAGIFGGISSITLGSGWGTTATTSAIISYGNSVIFTVTSNGTGQAASPTTTVNTVATKPAQGANTVYLCKWVSGTGTIQQLFGEQASTPSAITFTYNGTPSAGQTFQFVCG